VAVLIREAGLSIAFEPGKPAGTCRSPSMSGRLRLDIRTSTVLVRRTNGA